MLHFNVNGIYWVTLARVTLHRQCLLSHGKFFNTDVFMSRRQLSISEILKV